MKLIKTALFFFVYIILFSSCSYRINMVRSDVSKFKGIIKKYSDVVDVWRSDIYFMSSPPSIKIDLYARYGVSSDIRRIAEARDAVVEYLRDEITESDWQMTDQWRDKYFIGFGSGFMYIRLDIHFPKNKGGKYYYQIVFEKNNLAALSLRAWETYGNLGEAGFIDFMQDNAEIFQSLLYNNNDNISRWYYGPSWYLVQTGSNGIGFVFRLAEGADFETIKFLMESYLKGGEFNSYINNDEWIIVDDDFHVTLFIIMPNDDMLEYTAYKNTGYSVWEKYE